MDTRAFERHATITKEEENDSGHDKKSFRKQATVYDAVAGRINARGFIPSEIVISKDRDTTSTSLTAIAPETVLFRKKGAPTRYAESDLYFANEREQPELPDSELLKALHCYASDFYARAAAEGGAGDWRSLDETALLGLGVLMEEITRHSLGATGDLVFTEGEEVQVHELSPKDASDRPPRSSIGSKRKAKRRKLSKTLDTDE